MASLVTNQTTPCITQGVVFGVSSGAFPTVSVIKKMETFMNQAIARALMRLPVAALMLTSGIVCAQGQASADPSRYLAANCANCHGTNGISTAEPGIALAGMKADEFIAKMQAFKGGQRSATLMHQIAKGYSDEQIKAMAAYFSKQVRK